MQKNHCNVTGKIGFSCWFQVAANIFIFLGTLRYTSSPPCLNPFFPYQSTPNSLPSHSQSNPLPSHSQSTPNPLPIHFSPPIQSTPNPIFPHQSNPLPSHSQSTPNPFFPTTPNPLQIHSQPTLSPFFSYFFSSNVMTFFCRLPCCRYIDALFHGSHPAAGVSRDATMHRVTAAVAARKRTASKETFFWKKNNF